ncbi:MAG: DUF418 domain-containing protein [Gammaproteobacteria bacterium]|nr:DUF418 domain-containing protein [Gammaproteobacteria bacterium]
MRKPLLRASPVNVGERFESLDVLRGFALLGILLMNIMGFAFHSSVYSYPVLAINGVTDQVTWIGVELFAEGAMRCLFSLLFGAGVVLFTTGVAAKDAALHCKRNFWLLVFGLFNMYVLLWPGDVLLTYAIAGAILYLVRNAPVKQLLISAGLLIALMSAFHGVSSLGLSMAKNAAHTVAHAADPTSLDLDVHETAQVWQEFADEYLISEEIMAQELELRQESYLTAFIWNAEVANEVLLFVVPLYLLWDSLAMMLLGMALFKSGVLQGDKPLVFYYKLMALGFTVGLLVNGYEINQAISSDFALLSVFAQMQPTYHIGRLGMAIGYLGLLVALMKMAKVILLRRLLANVGRMALTNYLMQSFIGLMLFTGAGLGMVGMFHRWQVYGFVVAIWGLQMLLSTWWLTRYRLGPLEWLWRGLTYGKLPPLKNA